MNSVCEAVEVIGMKRDIQQDEEGKTVKKVCNDEEQYEDLWGYCRAWNIETIEQFLQKWIVHPEGRVRLDIFGELASYQSCEAECSGGQLNH